MLVLAREGAPEGQWLRAIRQTGGRGRMARAWESPEGNLHCSTLVRLRAGDPPAHTLALVAAVAVHALVAPLCLGASGEDVSPLPFRGGAGGGGSPRALRPDDGPHPNPSPEGEGLSTARTGQTRIKWPNDILVDGAKIAGILLQRTGDAVVIGIGINVTDHPAGLDRPVTSLAAQGASDSDATTLLDRLATIFAHWLSIWRAQGVEPVRQHWIVNAHPAGTAMRVELPDGGAVEGQFQTLDVHGILLLRLADGSTRAIHAGDIFLI
jgi:BirA family biotin operon repressor/biotin-[acetyl-CoA-carboxylase] ligase